MVNTFFLAVVILHRCTSPLPLLLFWALNLSLRKTLPLLPLVEDAAILVRHRLHYFRKMHRFHAPRIIIVVVADNITLGPGCRG